MTAWSNHQGQSIKGVEQYFEQWQQLFLYCYYCPKVRFEFKHHPSAQMIHSFYIT